MNIETITIIILGICGLAAGFFMHRSDFCIAGMFRDIFLFKNFDKIKPLVLLIVLNMIFFHILNRAGILKDLPFPWYIRPNWLILAGGVLFGIGMVLAGSCVVGVLYKIGSGQILALVAFIGICLGSLIFLFTVHLSSPITKNLFISGNVTIPQSLDINPLVIAIPLSFVLLILIFRWIRNGSLDAADFPEGYIHPAVTAAVLSLLSVVSYYVVNAPIGVTTSYAKFTSFFVYLFSPETYSSMPVFSYKAVDYHNYFTMKRISGSLGFTPDGVSCVQYPMIFGIIAGSALSAILLKEFHIRFRLPLKQYISSLAGGILLGYSSRIAFGCNIWHLAGGIPILAWGGFLFLVGITAGAWAGSIIIKRFVF